MHWCTVSPHWEVGAGRALPVTSLLMTPLDVVKTQLQAQQATDAQWVHACTSKYVW